jgi:hypothetical protein
MRRAISLSFFASLLILWGYWYPYQWWLKYGDREEPLPVINNNYREKEKPISLPPPFWGASLIGTEAAVPTLLPQPGAKAEPTAGAVDDLAGPVLDEIKVCFGDGPLASMSSSKGDLGSLLINLQNQLGPVQDDLLLEKKTSLKMKNGRERTLVYEWISPEEGSDVYWHETDDEGFPRPVDLPEGSGHDLATFERLKGEGSPSGKTSETRLIQLQNGLQLGVEKTDDAIQSLSLKDEGHLVKCRKDPVKSFVCDCLN